MFRESLRPSSGGQTAFTLPIVFCPVVTVVMLESRLRSCNLLHTVHTACQPTLQHHNSYNRTENHMHCKRSLTS